MNNSIPEAIDTLIGDVPVSEQLGAAIERMAYKDHSHPDYATHKEVEDLKKKIDAIMDLVGDISISEQIQIAINNIK